MVELDKEGLVNYHALMGLEYVNKNQYEEAYHHLLIAAILKNLGSRYNLGVLYEFGLGVEQSLEEAAKWYSACAGGSEPGIDYPGALQRVIRKKHRQMQR